MNTGISRPPSDIDKFAVSHEFERKITGGVANGDIVDFKGESCAVSGVETGGREGPRVRLELRDLTQKWVQVNLLGQSE